MNAKKYWARAIGPKDDFDRPITDTFYDGRTKHGPWAIMSPISFDIEGAGLGTGLGRAQKYEKQEDGRWLKTA